MNRAVEQIAKQILQETEKGSFPEKSIICPELELIVELGKRVKEFCETEEGKKCINCGMCKVRGF